MSKLELTVLVLAFALLAFTVEVVRRRRLSENYALMWIGVAVGGVALGVARPLIDHLSRLVGVAFGTSLVFALAILFLIGVCINLSMHVSRMEARMETLAREAALEHGPWESPQDGATSASVGESPLPT
jgi:hypothetical protein